jgi:two-component system phosphate regulon sensor histidine kinase PhoR
MMWPILTLLACGVAVLIYFQSRRRLRDLVTAQQKEIATIRNGHKETVEKIQAQQKALLNSMTEGLLVLDDRDTIQITNRALHEFFNVSHGLVGKTLLEAFRLHELAAVVERLKSDPQVLDYELEVPGLKSRWVHINAATIVDERSERFGAVLVFHDITRLKSLENTRREFVANVSHELRTPLSMIKGFAETLLDGAMQNAEVSTKFLQTIEKHADRLAQLIEDLLTISELENGGSTLNIRPVQLAKIVAAVFEDLRSRAEAQKVSLHNELSKDLVALCDSDRLRQVISNLVENAIKYGRSKGRVGVTAKPSDGFVEIAVRDDGCGIPADSLPRIFERFYRVDKARSRESGGTGLGLAIVKHIVQNHGGKVWVESAVGIGSTFYFTLPSAQRTAEDH